MKTLTMDRGTISVLDGDDVLNPPHEDGIEIPMEGEPIVAEPVAA